MSAYRWPMSRQTVLDLNGDLVAGAWLNFWVAGTTTPLVVYQDSALASPHPVIIEADSSGRFPTVYMPYTDYRERVRTPSGVLLWDDDGIANPAPAVSGGGSSVPDADLVKTGFTRWDYGSGPLPGYVRLNRLTIGNAGSGATERANADTEALYAYLYSRLSDALCPVSGGRGANAAADYAAGKTLQLPDARLGSPFGVADMGNSTLSGFTGVTFTAGNATTPGSLGGTALHTLTAGQIPANIPNSASSSTSVVAPPGFQIPLNVAGNFIAYQGGAASYPSVGGFATSLAATTTTTVTINPSGGAAHPNMPPFFLVTWYIRL